jgi:hypothetical protein
MMLEVNGKEYEAQQLLIESAATNLSTEVIQALVVCVKRDHDWVLSMLEEELDERPALD